MNQSHESSVCLFLYLFFPGKGIGPGFSFSVADLRSFYGPLRGRRINYCKKKRCREEMVKHVHNDRCAFGLGGQYVNKNYGIL